MVGRTLLASFYTHHRRQRLHLHKIRHIYYSSSSPSDMPRKPSTTELEGQSTTAEPRRSARISSLPKPDPVLVKEKKTSTTVKSGKKRSADEADKIGDDGKANDGNTNEDVATGSKHDDGVADGQGSNKKAKPTTPDSEKDELASDISADPQSLKPLSIGDSLPSIILKDEKGEDIDVSKIAAESGVIMFLVPKADTPGCTAQACGFRDIYASVKEAGYKVICLSADPSAAQGKWQTKFTLPYALLSDPQRTLIKALGASDGAESKLKTKRSHFIFEKGGKLVDRKVPVKPADSPKLALEFINKQSQSNLGEGSA